MGDIDSTIIKNTYQKRIQAINAIRTFGNRRQIRRLKLAAIEEAGRDILNTDITGARKLGSRVDKNSYTTYAAQVEATYKMYEGKTDYGTEILGSVVDMRTAFIAGESVSIFNKNEEKKAFIERFLTYNNLNGSKLMDAVLMSEIEGKALLVLAVDKEDKNIRARLFSWYRNKYVVNRNKEDYEKIDNITYKVSGSDKDAEIKMDKAVYIKTAGCNYLNDETPTRIGKVLTQCENASRATYDLRNNTHLFGKVMPNWETLNAADASIINKALKDKSFEIGYGFAGPAKMSLLEPSGSAADSVLKDLLASLRYISSMTAIPIHWFAWPELMSNRATAENFLEVVSAGTKKERLVWEEGLTKLIKRVIDMAVEEGIEKSSILKEDFSIKLPLISLSALRLLVDVWLPIYQDGNIISTATLQNMLPGIDPQTEAKLLEEERKEKAKRSPLANMPSAPIVDKASTDKTDITDGSTGGETNAEY